MGLLTAALKAIDPDWKIYNRAVSGSKTADTIANFKTAVEPYRPSHVILGTHPFNEASIDPQAYFENTAKLCRMCDAIGAIPIIRGAYTYGGYTAAQYQAMLSLNQQLDLLGRHRIDHMSTLDNGSGGIIGGSTYQVGDNLHLTDAGQEVHFRAIDLGIFTRGAAFTRPDPASSGAWAVRSDSPNGKGLMIDSTTGLLTNPRSFTMRARVKGQASAGKQAVAYLSAYAEGDVGNAAPIRFRNGTGPYDVADNVGLVGTASTVNPTADATVHDIVLSVNHAANTIIGYIDGTQFTSGTPGTVLAPCKTFVIGGRAESGNAFQATGSTFADIDIWASALRPETIADMYRTGRKPSASRLFSGVLNLGSPGVGGRVPNLVHNGVFPAISEATWQAAAGY
ncbi:SGNH/GDSL hydrolase family protein [Methylobacterium sp. E-041]|uniref:SGNH/GDSL hydrolase family protein n=1 Tax=Methylobacterium sp. E-041 TaxID=2836573 RepID=UPI001FBB120C|nr:SGNH/GDSL hydrolase family protein [Methylobacterium sp. E-041]MCJ2107857.1 SGNH/GDSL hydrolase family protein [Methylobacterium sp. E-041]